jgi:RNA polymerase sigma factor (sigma-70 family)
MDTILTGASLAERIKAGDSAAEEELVSTYRRGLLAIARARTRDREAAQDLTQQVLVEALKALRTGKLREAEKLSAFLEGIAHNVINSFLRTQVRRAECLLDEEQLVASDPVEAHESAERQRLLRREIETLSAVDQQILLWSLVEGHPLAEIAARLEMSHDAVRTRKSRAIRKLKKKLSRVPHERKL